MSRKLPKVSRLPQPQRTLADLSLDELKALAYDRVRTIERCENELRTLNTAILTREQPNGHDIAREQPAAEGIGE